MQKNSMKYLFVLKPRGKNSSFENDDKQERLELAKNFLCFNMFGVKKVCLKCFQMTVFCLSILIRVENPFVLLVPALFEQLNAPSSRSGLSKL